MEFVLYIALALVFLSVPIGIGLGVFLRKRGVRKFHELVGHGNGWQQVPADPGLWRQVDTLRQFAGPRGLQDFLHMAGQHRGLRFQAVQYRRPPDVGNHAVQWGVAVLVDRPVPGPHLRLLQRGFWARIGQTDQVRIGHPAFDQGYVVSCQDHGFARTVLHPGLAGGLAADQRTKHTVVDFAPGHLVAFRNGGIDRDGVLPMLDLLVDIHGSVPWQALAVRQ